MNIKLTCPRIITAAIATITLTVGVPHASASNPQKITTAQMVARCRTMTPLECKMVLREMLKRPELYKLIAEELRSNAEFQKYYNQHPSGGG